MSHRDRCMAGVFSKILSHLGIIKDNNSSTPACVQELPSPVAACSPSTVSHGRSGMPSSNQKGHERPQVSTFNVVFDKDVPPADKGNTANKVAPAGFRVRVSVPVYNEPFAPVVIECTPGSGGVQGLQWYSEKLMMDEDGDVAQEFLDEVVAHASGPHSGYTRMLSSFKLKMKTRPAQLKGPVRTYDGNVVQPVLI